MAKHVEEVNTHVPPISKFETTRGNVTIKSLVYPVFDADGKSLNVLATAQRVDAARKSAEHRADQLSGR